MKNLLIVFINRDFFYIDIFSFKNKFDKLFLFLFIRSWAIHSSVRELAFSYFIYRWKHVTDNISSGIERFNSLFL